MTTALTDGESEIFDAIQNASNMLLIRTRMDGEEVAVIAAHNQDEETGEIIITPLAVLVTDKIMAKLEDPTNE